MQSDPRIRHALHAATRTLAPYRSTVAVMREEHLDIEASLARALETGDVDEARDLLLHVIDVARPHFAKEEDVLFPLAERALAEETLLRLGERWAERRLSGAVRSGAAHA